MAVVTGKSRNPMLQAAWAGLRREQRAEKKAAPAEAHAGTSRGKVDEKSSPKKPAPKGAAKAARAKAAKTKKAKS